jgi:hypothetical protein
MPAVVKVALDDRVEAGRVAVDQTGQQAARRRRQALAGVAQAGAEAGGGPLVPGWSADDRGWCADRQDRGREVGPLRCLQPCGDGDMLAGQESTPTVGGAEHDDGGAQPGGGLRVGQRRVSLHGGVDQPARRQVREVLQRLWIAGEHDFGADQRAGRDQVRQGAVVPHLGTGGGGEGAGSGAEQYRQQDAEQQAEYPEPARLRRGGGRARAAARMPGHGRPALGGGPAPGTEPPQAAADRGRAESGHAQGDGAARPEAQGEQRGQPRTPEQADQAQIGPGAPAYPRLAGCTGMRPAAGTAGAGRGRVGGTTRGGRLGGTLRGTAGRGSTGRGGAGRGGAGGGGWLGGALCGVAAHTVTRSFRSPKRTSPIPLTCLSSSTERKPPCSVR